MTKHLAILGILTILQQSIHAQTFEKVSSVKNLAAKIVVLNETMTVIETQRNPGQRYATDQLPAELKVNNLAVTIDGDIGKIPPNVRMTGTPFRLRCLKISSMEMRKFNLKKRKWTFK